MARALRDLETSYSIRITANNFEREGDIAPPSALAQAATPSVPEEDATPEREGSDDPPNLPTTEHGGILDPANVDMQDAMPKSTRPHESAHGLEDTHHATIMRVGSRGAPGLRGSEAVRNTRARRIVKEAPRDLDFSPLIRRPPRRPPTSMTPTRRRRRIPPHVAPDLRGSPYRYRI